MLAAMRPLDLGNFNLNLLLALDGLLSKRSVTAAARQVRVTPSAMSHSLAELRDHLGDPLLVRSGRGMVLTPRAEALVGPVHTLLKDAERLLRGGTHFDPATTSRRFVVAAPDFLATLLLPPLLEAATRQAPNISFEIVPSVRRGNAWLLETGEVDLALGAIVDDAPSIRRMDLVTDGFACAVRKGHPDIRGTLSIDTYVRVPHLLITLGDDAAPTWIDQALAKLGKKRHIGVRVRYFMSAPLIVSRSNLLLTGPRTLIRYFAELVPLQVLEPPIELPTYAEEAYWHERFDADPAHTWLRKLLKTTASSYGLQERPRKRSW
jgi:DNA-binding transcriptional LysR family regulator